MPVKRHTKSRAPLAARAEKSRGKGLHKSYPNRSTWELSYHAELERLLGLRASGAAASRSVARSARHGEAAPPHLALVFDPGE